MKEFVKMPSGWIRNPNTPGLRVFNWKSGEGANHIAALMLYIAILHNVNEEPTSHFPDAGCAKISYTELAKMTGLSRAKIAKGIEKLQKEGILEANKAEKTNIYKLIGIQFSNGWAKLPYKFLYKDQSGSITVFARDFTLRKRAELDALKLYLLLLSFRSNKINHALITYDNITKYTGIPRNNIMTAVSFLITHQLIQTHHQRVSDTLTSDGTAGHTMVFYRPMGLGSIHMGNVNFDDLPKRKSPASDFSNLDSDAA